MAGSIATTIIKEVREVTFDGLGVTSIFLVRMALTNPVILAALLKLLQRYNDQKQ